MFMVTQVQGFTVQGFRVLSDKENRIYEELRAKETDTRCFRVINAYCPEGFHSESNT